MEQAVHREQVVYHGERSTSGITVWKEVVSEGGAPIRLELPLRLDLSYHSPTGFEWSYGGSGPAQLALALLGDALQEDEAALRLHQSFKWEVVAILPWQSWSLARSEVQELARGLSSSS